MIIMYHMYALITMDIGSDAEKGRDAKTNRVAFHREGPMVTKGLVCAMVVLSSSRTKRSC